ncbi:hypothetical protein [Roseateles saccharophilus]|uniref:Uncharacterized protein n=1 Tax=Roseateles saccharophilus TaxID=304 RepID=A0A4R3UTI1_ROSSA|nr:hypothetical protein [Roseateles saccharophilus]TCU95316.1 hypothetical protein EV671_10158 [Roseateles saccharophilus]
MRQIAPVDPSRTAPCAAPVRPAREPKLAERVAALDRLTVWPTLRLRCALRRPG